MTFNIADLAKVKVGSPPSYPKSPMTDISPSRQGNAAFEAKDYTTARSLYTHAMTIDQSNHYYPLNRAMANLKLAR